MLHEEGKTPAMSAYELLLSMTKPGTVGRASIESLRDLAYPEEAALRNAAKREYCGYCFQWMGGPLVCCNESHQDNMQRDPITKAQAQALLSAKAAEGTK